MESKFRISEILGISWRATKSQLAVLAGLLIGFTIISVTLCVSTMPAQSSITGTVIVSLISIIISGLFALGYYKNLFQALDGEEPQFSAYGQQARKILTYLIANLLMSIIVIIGCCAFIIPGIYLAIRLQFYAAFIVEEDAGIIESLKRSWEITKGQAGKLFLLFLAMTGLIIIGLICLFVGIFVAAPLVYVMYCEAFRKLNTLSGSSSEV